MAQRGRKTLYSPEMVAEIVKLLASGCVVADVCHKVGIAQDTYFGWVKKYPEFFEAVKRARADAQVGATLSLRKAMMPHDVTTRTTKTFSETRLRKVRAKDGTVSEVPYEYTKTEHTDSVTNEFDWRAAMEYLKRRDPENWADVLILKVTPEQLDVLKRFGLTPTDAFSKLIQNLIEANVGDDAIH